MTTESTIAPADDVTTLPVPVEERAALALQSTKTEQDITALVTQLKTVKVVNSPDGRDQAHALAMTATRARTTIEKAGKAARDDATKFSKAVIAEQGRLIALIEPEEKRVKALRDAWDQAEAERKEAEAKKERERISAHQGVIEAIHGVPFLATHARTSEMAQQLLGRLQAIDVSGLEEFAEAADLAKIKAVERVTAILADKQAAEAEAARAKAEQEAEAARLAAERAELERQQAEAAERERQAAAERAAQEAKLKADREALEAEAKRQADELTAQQKAMADALAAQQAELDRQRAELAAQQAAIEAAKMPPPALDEVERKLDSQPDPDLLAFAAWAASDGDVTAEVASDCDDIVVVEPIPSADDAQHASGEFAVIDLLPNDDGINHAPVEAPTAAMLIKDVAFGFGVEISTARRWLAQRADEFKTLNEAQEVTQ